MNEAFTITGAIFAVLTALIFNRKDVSDLKAEMKESNAALRAEIRDGFAQVNARFERMEVRMDKMQGDINTFAIVNALHDQRINDAGSFVKKLTSALTEIDEQRTMTTQQLPRVHIVVRSGQDPRAGGRR